MDLLDFVEYTENTIGHSKPPVKARRAQKSEVPSRIYYRLDSPESLCGLLTRVRWRPGEEGQPHWYGHLTLPRYTQNNSLRFTRGSGRVQAYDKTAIAQWYRDSIASLGPYPDRPMFPHGTPVEVFVVYYYRSPEPDIDGYLKKSLDVVQGYAYHDDKQVVAAHQWKLKASDYIAVTPNGVEQNIYPHLEVLVRRYDD